MNQENFTGKANTVLYAPSSYGKQVNHCKTEEDRVQQDFSLKFASYLLTQLHWALGIILLKT